MIHFVAIRDDGRLGHNIFVNYFFLVVAMNTVCRTKTLDGLFFLGARKTVTARIMRSVSGVVPCFVGGTVPS